MVVAVGIRADIAPVLKGYRFPIRLTTQDLLRRISLNDFCLSDQFRCQVSYDGG